ncbi:hypothetical protein NM688_g3360 [Phlebia brevispora]|uniref:Uncharacterized protein n=1 Tax=Phlebia brevispora TaxID=194682 RepID=A0ACC1T654_9APHY|nr:hypothetical protein NM688_g3360 [Phlebia brevispora]
MDQYIRKPRLTTRLRLSVISATVSLEEKCAGETSRTSDAGAKPPSNPGSVSVLTNTRCVCSPFDDPTNGDAAVIRTSNLAISSASVFDLSHQSPAKCRRLDSGATADFPAIHLWENSVTVDHRLPLIHCIDDRVIADLRELRVILASAKKYQLAIATSKLLAQFSRLSNVQPAKMYMFASERFAIYEDMPAGLFVTAPEYARLLAYHCRCSLVASSLFGYVEPAGAGQLGYFKLQWLEHDGWVWLQYEHRPALMEEVLARDGKMHYAAQGATILDVKLWGWYAALAGIEHFQIASDRSLRISTISGEILAREVEKAINTVEFHNLMNLTKAAINRKIEPSAQ